MTKTAIVILNYNGKKFLEQFLPAITSYSHEASVFVVDNHSTDDSVEFVQRTYPEIEVIVLKENLGFCGGYNAALKQIQATYYGLINSDIEVTEGWLQPIVELLDHNPAIAAVQPKILSFKTRNKFEYAGAAGGMGLGERSTSWLCTTRTPKITPASQWPAHAALPPRRQCV